MFLTVVLAASLLVLDVESERLFGYNEHARSVLHHLSDAERLFLFGDNHSPEFEIAHLEQPKRHKRSIFNENQDLAKLKKHLDLRLSPKQNYLDSHFLLLRRWANRTEPVYDNEDDNDCLYRSDNAALFACNDVRGIIKGDNGDFYFIHPLPERFHDDEHKVHVIVKKSQNVTNRDKNENLCFDSEELNNTTIEPPMVRQWTKHRRKRTVDNVEKIDSIEDIKNKIASKNKTITNYIEEIVTNTKRAKRAVLSPIFVETAVFVDRDLYKHMTVNFPKDTERDLVRFVLAMINAVQLLYHDPSLGRPVNFILKRLEILNEDPSNLKRPYDIDRFLSNFCTWQRLENPQGDTDPLHWDHALILTGLDLYVVSKNGKVSSQVVGLAPVAGMCTVTSSCTVNEGRHFESVYVVAHEIGHNLGMRHDGPLADNGCDPSAFIMSPTLGSGKITWSECSRNYLQKFLDTVQSRCLLDHGNSAGQLDHSAEGILPGERFDADQQCMLKYGRGSRHSAAQSLEDICRDLHCQRERYTWTSHPALEGTKCGEQMYCRGGECAARAGTARLMGGTWGAWGSWGEWAECASACLLDEGRAPAAAGVRGAARRCNKPRNDNGNIQCSGHDKKYQICHAHQCNNVQRLTVREFADQICRRAREVDPDLIGTGLQRIDAQDVSSACSVWCDTRGGGYKSRGWALPDGTRCAAAEGRYCIAGVCQKFTCSTNNDNEFSLKPSDCEWEALQVKTTPYPPTSTKTSGTWRRAVGGNWRAASGCHYHCMWPGSGLRLLRAAAPPADPTSPSATIQLCRPDTTRADMGCTQRKTPFQYATMVCTKYKERVRRLSGMGMQISPALEEPDRPCRVACQDERVAHRFYLVNGQEGWFPLGTACGRGNNSYCVSGKCLEFGPDQTPLSESVFTLPLLSRRGARSPPRPPRSPPPPLRRAGRHGRSLRRAALAVTAALDADQLTRLIETLNLTNESEAAHIAHCAAAPERGALDLARPVHVPDLSYYQSDSAN